jgi:hypothetical protein
MLRGVSLPCIVVLVDTPGSGEDLLDQHLPWHGIAIGEQCTAVMEAFAVDKYEKGKADELNKVLVTRVDASNIVIVGTKRDQRDALITDETIIGEVRDMLKLDATTKVVPVQAKIACDAMLGLKWAAAERAEMEALGVDAGVPTEDDWSKPEFEWLRSLYAFLLLLLVVLFCLM